jgi:hypothetical protein
MSDPRFPLKCQKRGSMLTYVHSQGPAGIYQAAHFHRCRNHGVVILPPSGIVRVDDPNDSAMRH